MAKGKTTAFFCKECGFESAKWLGQCPACKEWNTFVEEPSGKKDPAAKRGISGKGDGTAGSQFQNAKPSRLSDIHLDEQDRMKTGYEELDRVLGGGVVKGSLVLVGGDPGSGKGAGIAIFIVGHVTKEGVVAGPRVLEHMVDTVLYFEGDRSASYRIIRGVKNRFGSTNEIGVFEMVESGLSEVKNPSEYMLSGRPEDASGAVVACSMEGTRPMLLEVQALVTPTAFGMPRRTAAGTDYNRVNLLMAVLEKRCHYDLSHFDAYVNITGGLRMNEPALDLAIIMGIVSSMKDKAVDPKTIIFGEVGLAGEVRAVSMVQQRVNEAKKLGFNTCVMPEISLGKMGKVEGMRLIGATNVREAIMRVMG